LNKTDADALDLGFLHQHPFPLRASAWRQRAVVREENQDYVGSVRLSDLSKQVFVGPDFTFGEEYAGIAAGLQEECDRIRSRAIGRRIARENRGGAGVQCGHADRHPRKSPFYSLDRAPRRLGRDGADARGSRHAARRAVIFNPGAGGQKSRQREARFITMVPSIAQR